MNAIDVGVATLEVVVFGFSMLYAILNTFIILIGFGPARSRIRAIAHSDFDLMGSVETCPPVAVLVPAYNEEVGVVDAVKAFLELDYPALEVVVVNDGSKDGTMECLKNAFALQRKDVTLRNDLGTAKIRGIYEATLSMPERVQRLVVVDKDNGGRADALNCGINVCRAPYFITVDGDSILDPLALKHVMRMIQDDPGIQAAGGQIGVVNECPVKNGRVLKRVIPRSYLPLCQTLEYVRSFTTARSGFTRLNCLMILSGAFLLIRRDVAMSLGGFLTGKVKSKLLDEYSGPGKGTIGEDMELITRLHRYERENGRKARVVHSPLPVCWTEVPSSWKVLGRQRRRWQRGFLEIMRYHRPLLMNPAYGRVGLFSFPFLALFEGVGPFLEAGGYLVLPILVAFDLIDIPRALWLAAAMLGVGVLHSMVSVLCATWLEPTVPAGSRVRSALGVDTWRDRMLLLAACFLAECGYRQATVFWRMHGTWEYMRGIDSWGAMERKGFRTATSAATILLFASVLSTVLFGMPNEARAITGADPIGPAARPEEEARPGNAGWRLRESTFVFGTEDRGGTALGNWFESTTKWARVEGREEKSLWAGIHGFRREGGTDTGVILGAAASRRLFGGGSLELRLTPEARVTSRYALHAEGEFVVRDRLSVGTIARYTRYRDVAVTDIAPGLIAYIPRDMWAALRVHRLETTFDAGGRDVLTGWSGTFAFPFAAGELRLLGSSSGESYIPEFAQEGAPLGAVSVDPARFRARSVGFLYRTFIEDVWGYEAGMSTSFPERGKGDFTVHLALRHRW